MRSISIMPSDEMPPKRKRGGVTLLGGRSVCVE